MTSLVESTGVSQPPSGTPSVAELEELYRSICEVRRFELLTSDLYRDGAIPGFVHVSLGQEGTAVGACHPLRVSDMITSNHRGHGHCLAKGMDPEAMFAELFGRATGSVGGRGGSMHIADPSIGILGANGIVGAGLPIAVGAAHAARTRGDDVVVAFFGDGAVAQGAFHEAVNLAALWQLPVVFFCENNGYAEFTAAEGGHPATLAERAAGYGLPFVAVDGADVWAVSERMREVVASVRAGGGPVIVEARTDRWHGHYEGDQQRYRDTDDLRRARSSDPLTVAEDRLRSLGVPDARIHALHDDAFARIDAAAERARRAPEPLPADAGRYVTAERPLVREGVVPEEAPPMKYIEGIRAALSDALRDDPLAFLAGIDVGAGGGVFAVSRGLWADHPDRVLDTPISESAVLGLGVGGAMAGLHPIVEIMYLDFIGVAFDQLLNQAAKLHFMTAGRARMGMTVRTQFGASRAAGSQHSQSLEALLAHIPGLTVVMPSTAADAYGLLRTAIEDPNPVVYIENRTLYGRRSPAPPEGHRVPIGSARIARQGTDVTVVSYSRMVLECLEVAEHLADEGISVEVVDLRTISPWDRQTVLDSVKRTSRLVVVHEAVTDLGVGGEIVATVVDQAFWALDGPPRRVGAAFSPAPYAPPLEAAWLPQHEDIAHAIRSTLEPFS
ncbi:dehydrogenase E1 component subunit alpha/beta [Cnuibacter physcomitrellae]|uniref:alpha-ketoacid dehydrogenase subunit alpha/beta n=1 Tax=Cnuibacter physcomitrellae TaxID=1619308 RepID=UPI002175FCE4|nr:dehydrogenase E1 component subunit alpha/beta [Cnuibacter physcomitrellae]MCS5497699.1 dehydrogenase E1 component subunit alpha/beta [Cnuibacter physcomitrellae]